MGHIVNPVSYRLGASRCWNSVWPNDLSLSLSYSTLMKSDWDLFLFFKRFFDLKLLTQSGYIFSHVKIIRESKKIFCIVYFYDGGSLERSDNMKQILLSRTSQLFSIENMFFISLYSFLKLYQWNILHVKLLKNFKFSLLFKFFNNKKKLLFFKKILRINFLISLNFLLDSFVDFFFILGLIKFITNNKNFFSDYFNIISKNNIKNSLLEKTLLVLNKISILCEKEYSTLFFNQNFLIQLFSHSCFHFLKFCFLKKKFNIFFSKGLSNFFLLLRWRMFKRASIISKMIRCNYQFLSFSRYFLHYFADNFFFYFRIKTRLLQSVKKMISFMFNKKSHNYSKFKIVLKKLEVTQVNAAIMSKYIAIRLRQRFQLKEALMPMLRHLSNNVYVKGFRIVCAGRFTRKEIALYDLRTYSSVPFSGVMARLDFSLSEVVLKYSICGIKVWLHRYCLPEREFGIEGIGMNFMLPPPMNEYFSENLKFFEDLKTIPFRFEKFQNGIRLSDRSAKRKFIRFSTRMGPSYDFFFFNYNILQKKFSSKILIAKTNLS